MGYEVHITRKENWFDDGPDIALEEWLDVVRSDAEMRLDAHAEATVGEGAVLRVQDPSMSVWIQYSKHGQHGNMAWFWHNNGNVMVNNPDEEILRKMSKIATRLSAKVQGDDCELYGEDGNPINEEAPTHSNPSPKPWWRFW